MPRNDIVLVTGGSGAIARWCIVELLRRGYAVRTTVRDLTRVPEVCASIATQIEPGDRLTFATADLLEDDGWNEAVAGATFVLHVASPFPSETPKHEDELIVPARDGTLRVLAAAVAAGVKRVVLTSSVASIGYTDVPAGGTYTEAEWSDPTSPETPAYPRSKTIAERAAWEFMKTNGGATTLAVVNPGAVIGPMLGNDPSLSFSTVSRLLTGDMPAIPRLGFSFVDVRDIADLHVRAMLAPEAAGQRYIGVAKFAWLADARKVPKRNAPDVLVRLLSIFDPSIRGLVGELGVETGYSNEKARAQLGWNPRPLDDSIVDCARSLVAAGV
jgi:nucleoside-diphosphate-sugar epimerase